MSDAAITPGLRAITRNAVRARISDTAVDLFIEQGFEQVTVEQIAAAVGISTRSVHRYFPAKEDMVIGEPEAYGLFVRDVVSDRPGGESAWDSLLAAYLALVGQGGHDARSKAAMRLLSSTASLRARNLEKHLAWAELLIPVIADRLTGADAALRAEALVQASLSCFDTALNAAADPNEGRDPTALVRVVFDTMRPAGL